MASLCLTAGALSATLFAQTLHLAWTPADGVAREETWRIENRQFVLAASRSAVRDPAVAAASDALRVGSWDHRWPPAKPRSKLLLERADLRADYVLCEQGWCRPLESFLPRAQAPRVELAPCAMKR